jgi:hypothetical protein
MSELSVSIVVPVANGGKTFADCLSALSCRTISSSSTTARRMDRQSARARRARV